MRDSFYWKLFTRIGSQACTSLSNYSAHARGFQELVQTASVCLFVFRLASKCDGCLGVTEQTGKGPRRTMQYNVFSPHCQFASNLDWLYHQRASAQFPYWVMKLICWCNICNGNDTLRLGGNRFLPVQDQLAICLYVKATSNGLLRDSWLPWGTRPSRGSAFMRTYQPKPSWVCGQLVTQTSNTSGLAGNITANALLLNAVQKLSEEQ